MVKRDFSILVADGNEPLRRSLADALEPEGYEIEGATSGREAIDIVKQKPIHVVVMAVQLPDYSGLTIYHAIKEIRQAFLPCIFTAIEITAGAFQAALDEDVITVLPKPIDRTRLIHAIGWSINRYYPGGNPRPIRLDRGRRRFR